jgi:hypothetical protein
VTDNLYNSFAEVLNRIELICGKKPAFEELDITDEKALDKLFGKHPDIDSVIHFAALKVGRSGESAAYTSIPELILVNDRPWVRARKGRSTTIMSMFMAVSASFDPWLATMSPTSFSRLRRPSMGMQRVSRE